jgi:glycosyltransferase involved in cell wall biosynthesis
VYRCVHVIKNAQPESAAICRIIAELSESMRPLGYDTSVICLGEGGPLAEELNSSGAGVHVVAWTGARHDLTAWSFYSALGVQTPDIVHVHHGGRAVRMLSRLAGCQAVVQQVHSRILENKGTSVQTIRFQNADAVIAVSKAVAECVRANSVEVIYAGIRVPDRPLPMRRKEKLILGVAARLIALKGIHVVISAVAQLRAQGFNVALQIAGEGPCQASLLKQIRDLNMHDDIMILGWSPEMSSLRENWDIAVAPSLEEGFGLAALEAMAIGRPVIASRVGGLPELVVHGATGLLTTPGDVNELAAAITQLYFERDLMISMGHAAWERARSQFSSDHMVSKMAALYERLLKPGVRIPAPKTATI